MRSWSENLANAILLSVAKTSPEAFRIRPDGEEAYVVEHLVHGEAIEEMRAPNEDMPDVPSDVLATVIRRISVMANLPVRRVGEVAIGYIHLEVGMASYYFEIKVAGHGPTLELHGRPISAAEHRKAHIPDDDDGPYR